MRSSNEPRHDVASSARLKRYFKQLVRDFERASSRAAKKKLTPKELHKLRVLTRRLRSALWLIEQGSVKDLSFAKVSKQLRKLGRMLGARRQIDVLKKDADAFRLHARGIKSKRRAAEQDLGDFLRPKAQAKLCKKLRAVLATLEKKPTIDLALPRQKLKTRLTPWLKHPPRTQARLHRLRIQMKKTRYALEALGRPVSPIIELQDSLGRVHDLQVLRADVGSNARLEKAALQQRKQARRMIRSTLGFALRKLAN